MKATQDMLNHYIKSNEPLHIEMRDNSIYVCTYRPIMDNEPVPEYAETIMLPLELWYLKNVVLAPTDVDDLPF